MLVLLLVFFFNKTADHGGRRVSPKKCVTPEDELGTSQCNAME